MLKHVMVAGAVASVLLAPAMAQDAKPLAPGEARETLPRLSDVKGPVTFVQAQSGSETRASKLIGVAVYGPDNRKIGEINDLLLDSNGGIRAAVIGVGGFLGVGEKDVAVPFNAIAISRNPGNDTVEKVMVELHRDQLNDAPRFTYFKAPQTTGTAGMPPAPPAQK